MVELHTALAGELTLFPGARRPHNLISSRPDWVAKLAPGTAAELLPAKLASIFSSCGEAHRLCASLAIEAAQGRNDAIPAAALQRLQIETLREHVRRIAMEWPAKLVHGPQRSEVQQRAIASLKQAPVLPGMPLDAWLHGGADFQGWIETCWLGLPARAWLDGWANGPREWLASWSSGAQGWLPELLRLSHADADGMHCAAPALRVHAGEDKLKRFADQLTAQRFTSRAPLWRNACAETGAWTRLCEPSPEIYQTPWLRLGARLAEAVRLVQPGARRLSAGRVVLGDGRGLAWVEMARGLLMHLVVLDGERVAHCEVIAPTEWNFHPQGAVAEALESLSDDSPARIIALMTAYDPCVNYQIGTQTERLSDEQELGNA